MNKFYWINVVNMSEVFGPFKTAEDAKKNAIKKFPHPPDNGKDHYTVGILILKVVEEGEVVVSTKGEWRA